MASDTEYQFRPKLILALIALIVLAWILRQTESFDLKLFLKYVDDYPILSPLIFVLFYATLVTLLIPTLPVNFAAGVIWGGFMGGVLATLGSAFGSIIAFYLARSSLGILFNHKFDHRLLSWVAR